MLWRRAGELANDRCSQSFGGLQSEVKCQSRKADVRFKSVGKHGWVGRGEQGGLLLQGWHKCALEPIKANLPMTVW